MAEGWKARLSNVLSFSRLVFHWTFIPMIIYLGFRQGPDPNMPELHPLNLLWL